MKLGEPDGSGRRKPVPVEDTNFRLKADMVIAAVGQEIDTAFLVEKDRKVLVAGGKISVDPFCRTEKEDVFAGGDCVTGPATLIEALDMGNRAAKAIDACLRGENYVENREFAGIDTASQRGENGFPTKKTFHKPAFGSDGGLDDFREVERGFTAAEAMEEAKRCLRCYRLMVWEVDKSFQNRTK